jgi:ribosomal protein L11 methyltransferase
MTDLLRAVLVVSQDAAPVFEAALEAEALSVALVEDGEKWRLEALLAPDTDLEALRLRILIAAASASVSTPELLIEPVPQTDWVAAIQADMPEIRAGRYHIHGSHLPPDAAAAIIDIEIDAGLAFGTGDHESTRGCLLALDGLSDEFNVRSALDMGCGSGILAIAMAKTWGAAVIASDIDPQAAATARDNAKLNRVGDLVVALDGDGYGGKAVRQGAPYDLITANILAGPLIAMAPELARHLAPRGVAVLAGLLARQADAVIAAHGDAGLTLARSIAIGDWRALVMTRA